jgi:hypothetical protein
MAAIICPLTKEDIGIFMAKTMIERIICNDIEFPSELLHAVGLSGGRTEYASDKKIKEFCSPNKPPGYKFQEMMICYDSFCTNQEIRNLIFEQTCSGFFNGAKCDKEHKKDLQTFFYVNLGETKQYDKGYAILVIYVILANKLPEQVVVDKIKKMKPGDYVTKAIALSFRAILEHFYAKSEKALHTLNPDEKDPVKTFSNFVKPFENVDEKEDKKAQLALYQQKVKESFWSDSEEWSKALFTSELYLEKLIHSLRIHFHVNHVKKITPIIKSFTKFCHLFVRATEKLVSKLTSTPSCKIENDSVDLTNTQCFRDSIQKLHSLKVIAGLIPKKLFTDSLNELFSY